MSHQPPLPPPTFPWQAVFFKTALLGSAIAAALWLLERLRVVTAPILIGFFIAYALNPLVIRLRRWRVPPVLALTVPVLAVMSLAAVFLALVLPTMTQQLVAASQQAPARLYNTLLSWDPWVQQRFGRPLTDLVNYQDLSGMVQSLARELVGPAQSVVSVVVLSARDVLVGVGKALLVIVVAFFLLGDYQRIVHKIAMLVPRPRQAEVRRVVGRIDAVMAGFVRGQLLLFSLACCAFTLGLALTGVPFSLVIGPIAAVLYLVPYVGVVIGLTMSATLGLLSGQQGWDTIAVVALFGGFYGVDLLFITPRLIGNRVGLPPLAVLLGIIAFGELFGVIGVLIAVPVLACGRILLLEALDRYQRSSAYLGEVGDLAQTPVPFESEE
jgi:predicted PurR-regulated permease PerM